MLLPEAIKEIGVQPVRLRLTRNVEAAIEVEVLSEEPDEDEIPIDAEASEATSEGDEATAELTMEEEAASEESEASEAEEPKAEPDEAAAEDSSEAETTEDETEEQSS